MALLALLGLIAVVLRPSARASWRPLVTLLVGATLFKVLFIVNVRDRLPLMALFAVLAGYGAQALYDFARPRLERRALARR